MNTTKITRQMVRRINAHIFSDKPVYWDRDPNKRYRVVHARFRKGEFQIMPLTMTRQWLNASIKDNFKFY